MSKRSGWHARLSVTATGKGLVGQAGAVLLRRCADRVGLTAALGAVLPAGRGPRWWDRGLVLVEVAVAVVLGAVSMSDIEVLAHQRPVFGPEPSDSTVRRTLAGLNDKSLARIARARARVRAHVWNLLVLRPGGFPWLSVAGKLLSGWIVIDLDATLITAHSPKQGPRPRLRKGSAFIRSEPGARTPANPWPCCCARATPAPIPSPTISGSSATRSRNSHRTAAPKS